MELSDGGEGFVLRLHFGSEGFVLLGELGFDGLLGLGDGSEALHGDIHNGVEGGLGEGGGVTDFRGVARGIGTALFVNLGCFRGFGTLALLGILLFEDGFFSILVGLTNDILLVNAG